MSDQKRCPKCGAAAAKKECHCHVRFACGSSTLPDGKTMGSNYDGDDWQTDACKIAERDRCIAELEQELARRRSNTLLGLRGIGAPEDDPDPEFRLGVLAGGLKQEVERLRGVLNDLPAHLAQSFAACLPATMFMYDSKNDVQMDSVIPEESFRIQIKSAIEDWVPDPAASAASEPKEPTP